jgi:hypothetical protein
MKSDAVTCPCKAVPAVVSPMERSKRDGSRGVRFVLELLCAGLRRKRKAELRGSLSKGGRWQIELIQRPTLAKMGTS